MAGTSDRILAMDRAGPSAGRRPEELFAPGVGRASPESFAAARSGFAGGCGARRPGLNGRRGDTTAGFRPAVDPTRGKFRGQVLGPAPDGAKPRDGGQSPAHPSPSDLTRLGSLPELDYPSSLFLRSPLLVR